MTVLMLVADQNVGLRVKESVVDAVHTCQCFTGLALLTPREIIFTYLY